MTEPIAVNTSQIARGMSTSGQPLSRRMRVTGIRHYRFADMPKAHKSPHAAELRHVSPRDGDSGCCVPAASAPAEPACTAVPIVRCQHRQLCLVVAHLL